MQAGATDKYRRYTEADKSDALAAYAANGKKLRQTARQEKIPLNTLRDWIRGDGINKAVSEKATAKKADLITRLTEKIDLIEGAINPDKIEKADLPRLATAFGILVDKRAMLQSETAFTPDEAETFKQQLFQAVSSVYPDHAALTKIRDEFARLRTGSDGDVFASDTESLTGGAPAVESLGEALS